MIAQSKPPIIVAVANAASKMTKERDTL